MKIEKIVRISEDDKRKAIEFFRTMNEGKGILVVNGTNTGKEYKCVDCLVDLYSKEHLYIGSVTEFQQNRYMKAERKELIIERYAVPVSGDLVVVENRDELYAKRFRELDDVEKDKVFGIVLEECIWVGDN